MKRMLVRKKHDENYEVEKKKKGNPSEYNPLFYIFDNSK